MIDPDGQKNEQDSMAAGTALPPTISLLLGKSTGFLEKKGSATPRLDAELLLAEVLGMNRVDLYVNFDRPLNGAEVDRYRKLIRRRGAGEPVAYILGRAYFRNLELKVDRRVLVPRPETEHVVEAALAWLAASDWSGAPPRVLDIGTGSGAIALAVAAEHPGARVTGVDASADALELAAENARAAGLDARVTFIRTDIFSDLDPVDTFDLIISNPPYIGSEEWDTLPVDVRDFEPREALDGGPGGLDHYHRIIAEAHQFLKPGGTLILEIGYRQASEVTRLLIDADRYHDLSVSKDYAGRDRVVTARRVD